MSLGTAALLLGAVALAVAACTAYLTALSLGVAQPLLPVLAAALGVAAAGAPLAWLLAKLARTGADAQRRAPPAPAALPGGIDRAAFVMLAQREFARARRYGTGAALLLVDIDRGPRAADALPMQVAAAFAAELLRQTAPTLRGADVLAPYGTMQLAVFLAPADSTGALDVAERIRERAEQLQARALSVPSQLRLTVSVGVAHLRPRHLHLQALGDEAEEALAAARQAGGNCVRAAPLDATDRDPTASGAWRHPTRRAQGDAS